jgi:hypothetical protein
VSARAPGAGEVRAPVEKAGVSSFTSYLDVEVKSGGLNLFERQGDGKTEILVEALKRYGLRLSPKVSSPCG